MVDGAGGDGDGTGVGAVDLGEPESCVGCADGLAGAVLFGDAGPGDGCGADGELDGWPPNRFDTLVPELCRPLTTAFSGLPTRSSITVTTPIATTKATAAMAVTRFQPILSNRLRTARPPVR